MVHLFSVGVEGFRFLTVTFDLWTLLGVVVAAVIVHFALSNCNVIPL